MVAAATTSLPERAEAGRNYDYRYVWIRDQCYAGQAAAAAGAPALLDDAVRFVTARILDHGPDLKPAYTTQGAAVPDQRTLDLPGYPGGKNLIGNWVNQQFQLDAFGESLLLLAAAGRADRLDTDHWKAADRRRGRHHRPVDRTRRRDLGDRQPTLDPQPADLRRRAPGHRPTPARRRHRPATGSPWPTGSPPTPQPTRCIPAGGGNAPRRTRRWTPRCCCRRCAAASDRRRPAHHRHPRRVPDRPHPRRVRLPVPARRPAAGRRRRVLHPLRVPRRPRPAATAPARGGGPLVRTDPGLRGTTRAVLRGVRRPPAPTPRATSRRPSCTPCTWKPPPAWPTRRAIPETTTPAPEEKVHDDRCCSSPDPALPGAPLPPRRRVPGLPENHRPQNLGGHVHRHRPGVLPGRWGAGAVDAGRTGPTRDAVPHPGAVQPAVHHARHDHAAALRHPHRLRVRELRRAVADRRPRRRVPPAERLLLLAVPVRRGDHRVRVRHPRRRRRVRLDRLHPAVEHHATHRRSAATCGTWGWSSPGSAPSSGR